MWYYLSEGETQGPVPIQELDALLSQRKVKGDTLVWMEGMEEWKPLDQTDLMDQFDAIVSRPIPEVVSEASAKKPAYNLNDELPAGANLSRAGITEAVPGELAALVLSGAHWFYWIAGLTVANLVLMGFKSPISLALGLASPDLLYFMLAEGGSETELPPMTITVGIIYLVLSGCLALFGWMAAKGNRMVFIMGTIVVALDSLLFIFPMFSIVALVIHGYAVFSMFQGIMALGKLQKALIANEPQAQASAG